jgi:ferredoxin
MQDMDCYRALAERLDSFPHGFPATESGRELEILAYLFTPDEAKLASFLLLEYQVLDDVASMSGFALPDARDLAKSMASKGLIHMRRNERKIEVMLLPFVVGFYENQVFRMDKTFAQLVEDYFLEGFSGTVSVTPQFHRVIPIQQSVKSQIEILPEESVSDLLSKKQAWAVLDCICRKQKALIDDPCEHPIRVCLAMSDIPGIFDDQENMEALDLESALAVLDHAAQSGLVHTVSNHKGDMSYVCSCCTCGCGILRWIAEAGMANVVARSSYLASVDEELCIACGICESSCQFGAISIDEFAEIDSKVCVGCGVCTRECPEGAIALVMRDPEDVLPIPESPLDWMNQRNEVRGLS